MPGIFITKETRSTALGYRAAGITLTKAVRYVIVDTTNPLPPPLVPPVTRLRHSVQIEY